MSIEQKKSFIVTGASATGKTYFYHAAIESGYIPLPSHMTRQARENESSIDAWFLSKHDFIDRFNRGEYLEPTLEWALLAVNNQYYGTPKYWINALSRNGFCAMPSNILATKCLLHEISLCSSNLPIWVHLVCPDEIRKSRMEQRGLSPLEITKRLVGGDSIEIPSDSDLIFDTSKANCTASFMLLIVNRDIVSLSKFPQKT